MFFDDPFTGRDLHTSTVEFGPTVCFGNSLKTSLEMVYTTHGLECTVFHMTNDFKKKMAIFSMIRGMAWKASMRERRSESQYLHFPSIMYV